MRLVLDTNVVTSALLWGGTPRALLTAAREGLVSLWTSAVLVAELEEILARPKFSPRLTQVGATREILIGDYLQLVQWVRPSSVPRIVPDDPDDDHVLACALAAHADLIVSGDAHLLTLSAYQDIPIVNAHAANLRIVQAR